MSDTWGSGLAFGGEGNPMQGGPTMDNSPPEPPPITQPIPVPDTPVARDPAGAGAVERGGLFGTGLKIGPQYKAPDPEMSALDQSADMLNQRVKRANEVATNPLLQLFNPEGVQKAREFVPAAAEALQKIKTQQAAIKAGRTQGETLGLAPGEVADEASTADRVEVARAKALKGDLRVFKGLQAVDPKTAEAIQDQVHATVAGHLTKAQLAFDSLSGMQNQGQYEAKLNQLRKEGTLGDLEALGLKVPASFDAFTATKGKEASALREARMGIDTIRQKLEERNTYQPMEKKEAETYTGRLTTVHGDQITNGTWSRNGAAGTRGLVVNGMADPRDLGKNFSFATPEQRKAIKEEFDGAVPKDEIGKYREFNRTYKLATEDAKGNKFPEGKINTNPNVQQGIAEGLAAMLRGGHGGANVGLLNIETGKRGFVQGLLDSIKTNYSGALNTLSEKDTRAYLTNLTQSQMRDVMDVVKGYNDASVTDRTGKIAERAGALGLDTTVFGLGKGEGGAIADAIEAGRKAQIERMLPNHQAIGGGDGVLQLGAQRPGVNAVDAPPGATAPTTQLPGQQPLQTPVQQAGQPPAPAPPVAPSPGGGQPPAAQATQQGTPPAPQPGPAGGAPPNAPRTPVTVAGVEVSAPLPPGAGPNYIAKMQRIETGNKKDPWTATTGNGPDGKPLSSASGAFQFINKTWEANKPPGAPNRAADATPAQQAEALAAFTAKNAATLTQKGLPVTDTNLYVTHNLGATGGSALLTADPDAKARDVVGADAARNNPKFFKGNPTVATVLQRYNAEMADDAGPKPGAGGATAEAPQASGEKPGLMTRISRMLSQGVSGGDAGKDAAVKEVGDAAVEHAPAIGSTIGAVGGAALGNVPGGVAGGAAGGGAGQALKDWIRGNDQSPTRIAKEAALGGVLGVMPAGRPVAGAAVRTGGAAAVEGGAAAVEGKDAADIADAAAKGGAAAAGGELFGRALGMVGHKVFNMFAPDAKAAVQKAAGEYHTAEQTLATESPKLPGVGGAAGGPNPKYEAAEAAKTKAEQVLKDAGLKPEEAAYAHKVASEGVPKQEAEVARPGKIEEKKLGEGYDQLRNEVGEAGVGAVKPTPKMPDGPRAVAETAKMSPALQAAAERTEMAITAPAASWGDKWTQLQKARSALLELERDAASSTTAGRTQLEKDYRTLADSVRVQQEKAAKYVFGEKDGAAFMERLKTLDVRYRKLMEATNGGDIAKAATLKGEAGREAEKKFVAFAHDDPQAIAAYRAMRGVKGDLAEATVPWTVAAENLPLVGKVVKVAKLGSLLREWARERAAGSPVKFTDLVKQDLGAAAVGQTTRDLMGGAGARAAAM